MKSTKRAIIIAIRSIRMLRIFPNRLPSPVLSSSSSSSNCSFHSGRAAAIAATMLAGSALISAITSAIESAFVNASMFSRVAAILPRPKASRTAFKVFAKAPKSIPTDSPSKD